VTVDVMVDVMIDVMVDVMVDGMNDEMVDVMVEVGELEICFFHIYDTLAYSQNSFHRKDSSNLPVCNYFFSYYQYFSRTTVYQ